MAGTMPDGAVDTGDSQPPRSTRVTLWSPWMSLLAAVLVAGSATFLAAPVTVLVDSVVAAPEVRRAIVTWSCGVGLLRGAITFTMLGADRVLVVNPCGSTDGPSVTWSGSAAPGWVSARADGRCWPRRFEGAVVLSRCGRHRCPTC